MLKFFRKIRQELLIKNKFSKYLLYAIGEIVLVVIGILIALAVNNVNERKKAEIKVLAVFEEVLEELESDIKSIRLAGSRYQEKDSLTYLVLNTKLTKIDYKNNLDAYRVLTTQHLVTELSNNAYHKLVQMSDAIPEKFNDVMQDLGILSKEKDYVDLQNQIVGQLVSDIIKHKNYNYDWAIDFDEEDFIDYLLNDKRFKSDVIQLSNSGHQEHFQHALHYLLKAVSTYKKIAGILNKPLDYELLGFYSNITPNLIGSWTSDQIPGLIITIYVKDYQLRFKTNVDVNGTLFMYSESWLVNSDDIGFYNIVVDGNELVIKSNEGTYKKTKG